jgi:hypothetical protein
MRAIAILKRLCARVVFSLENQRLSTGSFAASCGLVAVPTPRWCHDQRDGLYARSTSGVWHLRNSLPKKLDAAERACNWPY